MTEDDVRSQLKSVKVIRGMEARTIAKWQAQGWELDRQAAGVLRTEITFRRVKPKVSRVPVLVAVGAVVVLGGVITIGVISESNDNDPASTALPAAAPTTPGESASPPPSKTAAVPTSAASETSGPLTAANNRDVAALLKMDYCDQDIGGFAVKYERPRDSI